jgi:hypothetical protein
MIWKLPATIRNLGGAMNRRATDPTPKDQEAKQVSQSVGRGDDTEHIGNAFTFEHGCAGSTRQRAASPEAAQVPELKMDRVCWQHVSFGPTRLQNCTCSSAEEKNEYNFFLNNWNFFAFSLRKPYGTQKKRKSVEQN